MDDAEIKEVISNYLKRGYSEDQIRKALLEKGLDEKKVNELIKGAEPHEGVKKKTVFLIIGATVVALLLLASYLIFIREPTTAQGHFLKGRSYFEKQNYEKALEHLSRAIELDPNYAPSYSLSGGAYFSLGDYSKALDFYRKAKDLAPDNLQTYRSLGWTYLRMGLYEPALAEFKQALELNPTDRGVKNSAYAGIGYVYLEYLEQNKTSSSL